MKCKNCGRNLTGEENFCRICGTPVNKIETSNDVELTDNLDVSKVSVSKNINAIDTKEIKQTKEEKDKELSAMFELANSPSQHLLKEENLTAKERRSDISATGATKIQSTQELLLAGNESSKKIKKILDEMNSPHEEQTPENINTLVEEPTVLIPNDLIKNYSKNDKQDVSMDLIQSNEEKPTGAEEEKLGDKTIPLQESPTVLINSVEILEKVDETIEIEKTETPLEDNREQYQKIENSNVMSDGKKELDNDNEIQQLKDSINEEINKPLCEERKSRGGLILLLILFFISLCAIVYLYYRLVISYNRINDISDDNDELQNEISELKVKNNTTNSEISQNNSKISGESIQYNEYVIRMIDDFEYGIDNNKITIDNGKLNISMQIKSNLSYTNIRTNIDDYKNILASNSLNIETYGTKVMDDREYVIYNVTDSNKKVYLIAYSKIDDTSTAVFIINNGSSEVDYENLKVTNQIISAIQKDNEYSGKDINLFKETDSNESVK